MKRTLSEEAWVASVGKHCGVAIRILDVFEKMLESKGISIPDEDQTGDEAEACLYGMTYGMAIILCVNDECPFTMPEHDIGLHGRQESNRRGICTLI